MPTMPFVDSLSRFNSLEGGVKRLNLFLKMCAENECVMRELVGHLPPALRGTELQTDVTPSLNIPAEAQPMIYNIPEGHTMVPIFQFKMWEREVMHYEEMRGAGECLLSEMKQAMVGFVHESPEVQAYILKEMRWKVRHYIAHVIRNPFAGDCNNKENVSHFCIHTRNQQKFVGQKERQPGVNILKELNLLAR